MFKTTVHKHRRGKYKHNHLKSILSNQELAYYVSIDLE